MNELTLADVIEGLTGNKIEAPQPITTTVVDSRQVVPGALFVALPGARTDGHNFVGEAFEQGALAAIVHRPVDACPPDRVIRAGESDQAWQEGTLAGNLPLCIQVEDSLAGLQQLAAFWRNRFKPQVIGITGSVGKSTTKELVWSVLSSRYNTLKNEGNLNNEIGLPLTLLALNDSYEQVVLEMGMYDVGEIALLCKIARPRIGVLTNIGPTHLERLGTMERIVQAKAELVQALPASSDSGRGGVAILNYDDPRVLALADKTEAQVVTYGLSPEADLWASDVESAGLEGIHFVFHYRDEEIHARVPLLGRHSVHTALRAALVGLVEELAWEDIMAGLQTLPSSTQLRLVAVPGPNGSTLLDDTYNASPASTIAALNLLDDLNAPRKIAVLGDMLELGSFEEEGHRKVGCRAATVVDQLIVIGSRADLVAEEARACGLNPASILKIKDNRAVIAHLEQTLEPEDVVLIKGSNAQKMDEIVSTLVEKGRSTAAERRGK